LLVLALFIAYVGIAYTLPGAFAGERAALLTAHLKASGLRDAPRILYFLPPSLLPPRTNDIP
jgi:ATP-binding cassette subfamily A (ABC1) protein 3